MNKKLLAASLGLALAATLSVAAPATAAPDPGYVVTCTAPQLEYPHLSSYAREQLGKTTIKVGANLTCESVEPLIVQATVTLQTRWFGFLWLTAQPGVPVSKTVVPGVPQTWGRDALFAETPCVPGWYRASLSLFVETADGPVPVEGNGQLSPEKYLDCKRTHVSMVIDDTGSMGNIIGSVSASLGSLIQSQPEDEDSRWSLTTFKDNPTFVGTTDDRGQALNWVNALTASGGGDCPEDALGGISNGLNALGTDPDTDKQMVVATDASAHGGDVDGIIAAAQAAGVHVNVLLAGDCDFAAAATAAPAASAASSPASYPYEVSSQVVLKRIAEETGGKYFFIPGGSTEDYTAALDAIFAGITHPGEDTTPPTVKLSGVPATIWSPNHKMVDVTPTVTATDDQDPNPVVRFVGVQVSQPDDGQGDGNTADDVQITSNGRILVRAERSATEGDRTYTITYRATDASGNTGFGSATVVVPKSNSSH